jgi:transposase
VTAGQRGDAPVFPEWLAEVPPECPVEEAVLDRAFDSDAIRELLVERDIAPCIPSSANRKEPIYYDKERYQGRNVIERLFGRLKQFRRVATRYDKLAETFLAFVQITAVFQMIR